MKLNGEDIIPPHGTGKGNAILCRPRHHGGISRLHAVTMDKIETRLIGNIGPKRMRLLLHAVPAHMRDFQTLTLYRKHLRLRKALNRAGKDAQPAHIAFFAMLEKHLQADTDTEKMCIRDRANALAR